MVDHDRIGRPIYRTYRKLLIAGTQVKLKISESGARKKAEEGTVCS